MLGAPCIAKIVLSYEYRVPMSRVVCGQIRWNARALKAAQLLSLVLPDQRSMLQTDRCV